MASALEKSVAGGAKVSIPHRAGLAFLLAAAFAALVLAAIVAETAFSLRISTLLVLELFVAALVLTLPGFASLRTLFSIVHPRLVYAAVTLAGLGPTLLAAFAFTTPAGPTSPSWAAPYGAAVLLTSAVLYRTRLAPATAIPGFVVGAAFVAGALPMGGPALNVGILLYPVWLAAMGVWIARP